MWSFSESLALQKQGNELKHSDPRCDPRFKLVNAVNTAWY
ncbi:hypothetical protein SVI_1618 [Shewanella violacea DSS12]|uniref:Uncharacterized protein n=1 Tax=Shewanella violacea (strain JCM 10179 / CIP 106290 / LMG 19151 / DSS12) TaxID=637905 RepID=D4ZIU0_SHEVD|nr:hypothetical protein SVI_1618 [Shewanella violacea DSS12]